MGGLHCDSREALGQIVVHLSRQALALILLRREQAAREQSQLALALPKLLGLFGHTLPHLVAGTTQLLFDDLTAGDVLTNNHHHHLVVSIAGRPRHLADPDHALVVADLSQLPGERLAGVVDAFLQLFEHSLAVIGMEHADDRLADEIVDLVAELFGAVGVD